MPSYVHIYGYFISPEKFHVNATTFLDISRVYLYDLFKIFFRYVFQVFFALFSAVNEVNSKNSQISRRVINFQVKILTFKGIQDISNSNTFQGVQGPV